MLVLPEPRVLFGYFELKFGTAGNARVRFEQLVTEMVAELYGAASTVAGPGGRDWGIDTLFGRLDENVVVWQSKFFLEWGGATHRASVRASFQSLMGSAEEEGFAVSAWTLCVPCLLPPGERLWFDRWAAGRRRKYGVAIELWDGFTLARMLAKEDLQSVLAAFFPSEVTGVAASVVPEPLAEPRALEMFDDALFVRQLSEAGYVETDVARALFFVAEALARDVGSRGDKAATMALAELHLEVHARWEALINARLAAADCNGRMDGLVDAVLAAAAACTDPPGLTLRAPHRRGITHRLAEDRKLGWVTHWREIADAHDAPHAGEMVAAALPPAISSGAGIPSAAAAHPGVGHLSISASGRP